MEEVKCDENCRREHDRQENAPYRADLLLKPEDKPLRWKPKDMESEY